MDSPPGRHADHTQRGWTGLEARKIACFWPRSTFNLPNGWRQNLPNVYITNSHVVQGYYRDEYGDEPAYIPYSTDVEILPPAATLAQYGLEPGKLYPLRSRAHPENCAHHLVQAFRELDTDLKCVIVGDAPYAEEYIAGLKELAANDQRIIFTGYVFGTGYQELGPNAYVFVEDFRRWRHTPGFGGSHGL